MSFVDPQWKYTDATHTVVLRVHEDGRMESMLVSALFEQIDAATPEGEAPQYPDIQPED